MNTEFDILNASILVVDDQPVNVLLLEQLLASTGYTRVRSTMNPAGSRGPARASTATT